MCIAVSDLDALMSHQGRRPAGDEICAPNPEPHAMYQGVDDSKVMCYNVAITREKYDHWRYRYPRSEAERNEAERRALKEGNNE